MLEEGDCRGALEEFRLERVERHGSSHLIMLRDWEGGGQFEEMRLSLERDFGATRVSPGAMGEDTGRVSQQVKGEQSNKLPQEGGHGWVEVLGLLRDLVEGHGGLPGGGRGGDLHSSHRNHETLHLHHPCNSEDYY